VPPPVGLAPRAAWKNSIASLRGVSGPTVSPPAMCTVNDASSVKHDSSKPKSRRSFPVPQAPQRSAIFVWSALVASRAGDLRD
jgi:hypothetical protein